MDDQPASVARGFLFADLRNYSAWVESHGDHAAVGLLREYRGLVRQAVAEFAGAEIKTEGDSFYVVFGSPSAAVNCGLRILVGAAESQAAAGGPIPVGIGVHAGETVATDEGYVGSAVNVAARVCAQARAGELLVTDAVRALTRTYLDVTFVSRGRRRLKGISEPIGLYRVMPVRSPIRAPWWKALPGWWRIAAAAAVVVVAVVVSALVGGAIVRETAGEPGPSASAAVSQTARPSPSASPSATTATAFPTADETRLLGLIPEGDRESCQQANPEDAPIVAVVRNPGQPADVYRAPSAAAIECDLGGIAAPDRIWFWELLPGSGAGRVGVVGGDPAEQALAAHSGLVDATPGTCRQQRPALETWSFGGTSGKLVCYETDTGDAVLLWAFDDGYLFGKALREDRDMPALLDWWEDVGRFAVP